MFGSPGGANIDFGFVGRRRALVASWRGRAIDTGGRQCIANEWDRRGDESGTSRRANVDLLVPGSLSLCFTLSIARRALYCGISVFPAVDFCKTPNFLPERDYLTFASLLSQIRLSSVRRTHVVENFGYISSPNSTLAILWPPCKILQRLSQGNPSIGGVKPPIPLRLYTLPYWCDPPFLIFDIRAFWRSRLSAKAPECQNLKMVG